MTDKKLIQKLIDKYKRKAGVSLMLYQETGNQKHEKISEEAEFIAAALRVMLVDRPHETRLSKLLRQYPKAKAEVIKEYYQCPAYLGYSCPSPKVNCKNCWDVPVEEDENGRGVMKG